MLRHRSLAHCRAHPELTAQAEILAQERKEWHHLKHTLSAARRRARATLHGALRDRRIGNEPAKLLDAKITALGERVRATTPVEELRRRLAVLEEIDAELAALVGHGGHQHAPDREPRPATAEEANRPEAEPRRDGHRDPERGKPTAGSRPPEKPRESAKVSTNMQALACINASPYYNTIQRKLILKKYK